MMSLGRIFGNRGPPATLLDALTGGTTSLVSPLLSRASTKGFRMTDHCAERKTQRKVAMVSRELPKATCCQSHRGNK